MSVLSALASRHTDLSARAIDHLHVLLGEWQLLSDLAFADCLLFAPARNGATYVVIAQVRPYPAQTLYPEDMVGTVLDARARPKVALATSERRIVREGDPEWREGTPIREETIPVIFDGEPIAVISSETNLATARTPSHLELSYMRAAGDLAQMIADGVFPFAGTEHVEREVSPRVGDGFILIGPDWTVSYASPNAVSAYRRLGVTGNLIDESFRDVGLDEQESLARLTECQPHEDEIEENGAWVLRRFIPIVRQAAFAGAIGLVRDITELRRRDRMLLIKDATIREIHHRVKNNLQTVASLLRLQARRLDTSEARIELEESVRRISSIALVHETLSRESTERVDFDEVAQRILAMTEDSLIGPDRPVTFIFRGGAGDVSSDIATPLSLILSELIQNAVEHAFVDAGGTVLVQLDRLADHLALIIEDDGGGLPRGFTITGGSNLGLQIVRTLVTELGGELYLGPGQVAGTRVNLTIPLASDHRGAGRTAD